MPEVRIFLTNTGLDGMIDAMKEVSKVSFETTGRLEKSLDTLFVETQAKVHIITGRLKASGRTSTDFDGKTWSGEMVWGGDDSDAYYAIYEQARGGTRPDGTPHDWLSGIEAKLKSFEDAIDSHFDPLKGK